MKKKMSIGKKALFLIALPFLIIACDKHDVAINNSADDPLISGVQVISESEAISTLHDFFARLNDVTRSKDLKRIQSIETHYSDWLITRSGNPVPDAYLVNFADNAGFAVLGANNQVAPIIFVIDEGSATWDTILSDTKDTSDNLGINKDNILSLCLSTALTRLGPQDSTFLPDPDTIVYFDTLIIPAKTTDYPFGQIRTYCHKDNGGFVISGCASVAQAIVVAYNNFPFMHVDGELLDYDDCSEDDGDGFLFFCRNLNRNQSDSGYFYVNKQDYFYNYYDVPNILSHTQMESVVKSIDPGFFREFVYEKCDSVYRMNAFERTRYKLISSMFYNTSNATQSWKATGTLPSAVKTALEGLGYTSVTTKQTTSFNYEQRNRVKNMLTADKPVIMCGWSLWGIDTSHYWVIDGYRNDFSGGLLHCNWGWRSIYNGWFSPSCIRYTEGVIYDNPETTAHHQYSTSGWANLITFTYNIPAASQHFYCYPSSNYKTLYEEE